MWMNCRRPFTTTSAFDNIAFTGASAYDLLQISETCSLPEIKASFRKLAKEYHPDIVGSKNSTYASPQFVQILAAYEILFDSKKRALYDTYLLSQRMHLQMNSKEGFPYNHTSDTETATMKPVEAVAWLEWYRSAMVEILSKKHRLTTSGYFDILQNELYSALHAAYYGPVIRSLEFLPQCFETEERSLARFPEVLHLVSGRDLFGMVRIAGKIPRISHHCYEKNMSSSVEDPVTSKNFRIWTDSDTQDDAKFHTHGYQRCNTSDAYKNLELYVCGKVIAVATRVLPRSYGNEIINEDSYDHIHVFLNSHGDQLENSIPQFGSSDGTFKGKNILGTISGLGTSQEEGSCFVYDRTGKKTHIIMKYRTLLVKHMNWYQLEDYACECRCSRACLPSSKFWLFEPRCATHDIGGWYVETFGRDYRNRTVPAGRYWDGLDPAERRLHPAVYLIGLAYRSLDIEAARRNKLPVKNFIGGAISGLLNWCRKLI